MASCERAEGAEPPGWLPPAALLCGVVCLFGFRFLGGERVDLAFQDLFRTPSGWVLPKEHPWLHPLLYEAPKILLVLIALGLGAAALLPARFPAWMGRRRALYLLACLAVVPVVCTQLRAFTGMATPKAIVVYGGDWEHRVLFEGKPEGYPSNAFPAGHASGGFSLLGAAFAWRSRRSRLAWAWVGIAAGLAMGLYQVARGEHFLSHTLATGSLAWLICVLLARLIKPAGPGVSGPTSS